MIYSPKRLYFDGSDVRNDLHHIFSRQTVQLFHYTMARFDGSPKPYTYWSDCLTDEPTIVSEATGIGANECVWRIEWRFPFEKALDYLSIGEVRFQRIGVFREYNNQDEIDIGELSWHKMALRT